MTAPHHSTVRTLLTSAGRLAQYCDRAEHNEAVDRDVILTAGDDLRILACRLLTAMDTDPIEAYASRLTVIERRSPAAGDGAFDADVSVRQAKTWLQLQRCQTRHDSTFHPDVNGQPKVDQLRHYTQHLTKLAWYFQDGVGGTGVDRDATIERTTDALVFGVKLATVCGQMLPDEAVDAVAPGQ